MQIYHHLNETKIATGLHNALFSAHYSLVAIIKTLLEYPPYEISRFFTRDPDAVTIWKDYRDLTSPRGLDWWLRFERSMDGRLYSDL